MNNDKDQLILSILTDQMAELLEKQKEIFSEFESLIIQIKKM